MTTLNVCFAFTASSLTEPVDPAQHWAGRRNGIILSSIELNLSIAIIIYVIDIERIYQNRMDFAYINCAHVQFQDSQREIEKITLFLIKHILGTAFRN